MLSRRGRLTVPGAAHLALFPFVKQLGKNRRAFGLPGDDKSWLLRVAEMLDITEDQNPALAKIFIEFAAR